MTVKERVYLGENMASLYLNKLDYYILDRNFNKKYGDIDIVALKGDIIFAIKVDMFTPALSDAVVEEVGDYALVKSLSNISRYKKIIAMLLGKHNLFGRELVFATLTVRLKMAKHV